MTLTFDLEGNCRLFAAHVKPTPMTNNLRYSTLGAFALCP